MARLSSLVVLAACALLARHVSTLLFANAPSTSSRSLRMAQQAVDERDEGLVLIKPEESGKVLGWCQFYIFWSRSFDVRWCNAVQFLC